MSRPSRRGVLLASALLLVPLWGAGCSQDTSSPPTSTTDCQLAACSVFFTEVLADPKTNDASNEYVELYNPGADDLDLNGCTIELVPGAATSKRHIIRSENPVIVPAGGFLQLGPPAAIGVDYQWGDRLGELPNSSTKGAHVLRLSANDVVVDEFTYMVLGEGPGLGEPSSGASFQLDAVDWSCEANDDPANWCAGKRVDGDRQGTPGATNDACVVEGQCIDAVSGERRPIRSPSACDLVFTEVFNNPAGTDDDLEWLELYVAGAGPYDLNGLLLQDGDDTPSELQAGDPNQCVPVLQGERAVLLQKLDALGGGGGHPVALFDFALGNRELSLRLLTPDQQVVIDEFSLGNDPGQGVSWSRQDELPITCPDSSPETTWTTCDYPSPGAANDCVAPPVTLACVDATSSETRPVVHPNPCQVIITEVLNNPEGTDGSQEWIELYVVGPGPYDLNGLQLAVADGGAKALGFGSDDCVSAVEGERLLLSRSFDPAENGGLDTVHATFSAALLNNDLPLSLLLPDGTTALDSVMLGSDPGSGVPWTLRETHFDCAENDVLGNWCGGTPTPLAANVCPGDLPAICLDAGSGEERPIVHPGPCDLVISEVLNNPEGTDGNQEWIEVVVVGDGPFDLDGLMLRVGTSAPAGMAPLSITCTSGSAGDRFLLVKDETNADGDALFTATLGNNDLALALLLPDGETVIDATLLGSDPGQGVSWNLDENRLDCVANDLAQNWCGRSPTPKEENEACPVIVLPGHCLPPMGGDARAIVSPPAGAVVISEFFANPAGEESPQEWIELYVDGMGPYDLNGLLLSLQERDPVELYADVCVEVMRGDWVLLAKSPVAEENGQLPTPDLLFTGSLVNSDVRMELYAPDGTTLLDAMTYGPASTEGESVQLDIDSLTTAANDDEAAWCKSGDAGTPMAANASCTP